MATESLSSVINSSFFSRVVNLTRSKQNSATALKAAFSGSSSSNVSLSNSLSTGSRIYTQAARSLNQAVAAMQVTKDSLEKLGKLADRLGSIVDAASKPSLSSQERNRLDGEYQDIGRQFEKIIKETKIGDKELFESKDLSKLLAAVGLNPDESRTIGEVFHDLILTDRDSDRKLASAEIRGSRPVPRPQISDEMLEYAKVRIGRVREEESIFDSDRSLRVLSDVAVLKKDVAALSEQIKTNLKTMNVLEDTLIANYGLARAIAISMQDLQYEVKPSTEADDLAKMLRDMVRKNSNSAMRAQAGNLDSLAVASYAFSLTQDK